MTELQKQDSSIQNILQKGKKNFSFYKDNGIIFCKDNRRDIDTGKVVVPVILRERLMAIGHDSKMAGHLGIAKTSDRIKANFFWPGMTEDVRRYCKSCDVCQRTIHKGSLAPAPLGKMPLIDVPFKRVAIDLIGPINPKSSSGFRYILTLVDYATRYPEAVPLKNCTAKDVANALVSIFSRLGVPEEILTDQGRQFTSQYMKEVMNLLEINHLMTTPYHPMCNGLVESFNITLK